MKRRKFLLSIAEFVFVDTETMETFVVMFNRSSNSWLVFQNNEIISQSLSFNPVKAVSRMYAKKILVNALNLVELKKKKNEQNNN